MYSDNGHVKTHHGNRNTMSAPRRCLTDKRRDPRKTVRVTSCAFHKEWCSRAIPRTRCWKCVRCVALPRVSLHYRNALRICNMLPWSCLYLFHRGPFLYSSIVALWETETQVSHRRAHNRAWNVSTIGVAMNSHLKLSDALFAP